MSIRRQPDARLNESEAAIALLLVFGVAVMIWGWLADLAGLPLHPWAVLVLSLLATAAAWRYALPARENAVAGRFAGLIIVSVGSGLYILWLAWPSLLPVTDGPDLVHHLTLIHFIQQRHALPTDDGILGAYLGEMTRYPPGSHILAALLGEWLRVDALRMVQPVFAAATALKVALVYCTLLRLSDWLNLRARLGAAIAGALLLFVPHAYLLQPIIRFSFYAQVVSETFAVATLWALVAWWQAPSTRWAMLFALFGIGVVLCWPILIPIPMFALLLTVAMRRTSARAVVDLTVGIGPPLTVLAIVSVASAGSTSVLASGGSVLVPTPGHFGWPFLVLAAAGVLAAFTRRGLVLPVIAFAAGCLVQIAALAVLQRALGATNLYLAFKTVHLLVYPAVILAGVFVAVLCDWVARPLPRGATVIAVVCPMVVAFGLSRSGLPVKPMHSPITAEALAAGKWARGHVPAGCVDYLFPHWLTGYWLHVDVLGNSRQAERARHETFEYRDVVGRWIEPGSLRYAIAGNYDQLPADARANMRVLQRFGAAAVVERSDGRGTCPPAPPPISDIVIHR